MVIIENKEFKDAIDGNEYTKAKVAILAGSSEETLKKIYNGKPDLRLKSIHEIAEYLGLDVIVSFRPKTDEVSA